MSVWESKLIVIDPGHGGTHDPFRKGPRGEREEQINLRVGLSLEKLFLQTGAKVSLTRHTDREVSLAERVKMALELSADLFFSIHHNSANPVDPSLNYPIVLTHGHVNQNSINGRLAFCLGRQFSKARETDCFIDSDQTIFHEGLHVLRCLHKKVPAVLGEYSFFSHPGEEERLKNEKYCQKEALAYFDAAHQFFTTNKEPDYSSTAPIWPEGFREEYMKRRDLLLSQRRSWRECFKQAQIFIKSGDPISARDEFLNSLALLRNHPELFSLIKFFTSQEWLPSTLLSTARFCIPLYQDDEF